MVCGSNFAVDMFPNMGCYENTDMISSQLLQKYGRTVGTCNSQLSDQCVNAFAVAGDLKSDTTIFPFNWSSYLVRPCGTKVASPKNTGNQVGLVNEAMVYETCPGDTETPGNGNDVSWTGNCLKAYSEWAREGNRQPVFFEPTGL